MNLILSNFQINYIKKFIIKFIIRQVQLIPSNRAQKYYLKIRHPQLQAYQCTHHKSI